MRNWQLAILQSSQAKQEEQTVVVLWISGSAGGQEAFHQQAASRPGDTFLVVDVTVGKDNRMLATSLKVKGFPTVQVYRFAAPLFLPLLLRVLSYLSLSFFPPEGLDCYFSS